MNWIIGDDKRIKIDATSKLPVESPCTNCCRCWYLCMGFFTVTDGEMGSLSYKQTRPAPEGSTGYDVYLTASISLTGTWEEDDSWQLAYWDGIFGVVSKRTVIVKSSTGGEPAPPAGNCRNAIAGEVCVVTNGPLGVCCREEVYSDQAAFFNSIGVFSNDDRFDGTAAGSFIMYRTDGSASSGGTCLAPESASPPVLPC